MGRRSKVEALGLGEAVMALAREGKNFSHIARILDRGLTRKNVQRYLASSKRDIVPVTHQEVVAQQAVASVFNTQQALEQIFGDLNVLLEKIGDEKARERIACLREMRNCVETGMDILRTLYDVEEVKAFQEEVLQAVGEADAETRERIIRRLQERRSARRAFGFSRGALP